MAIELPGIPVDPTYDSWEYSPDDVLYAGGFLTTTFLTTALPRYKRNIFRWLSTQLIAD